MADTATRMDLALAYDAARLPMDILSIRAAVALEKGADLSSWAEIFQARADEFQALADQMKPKIKLEEAA